MSNLILISFTSLDSPGGVPRWNRDFVKCFPNTKHYSVQDLVNANPGMSKSAQHVPEWDLAQVLNQWLIWSKKIKKDDLIVVDGFWGLGLENFNVISVAHGIWSHLTQVDVKAGKQPEFPRHHKIQLEYRRKLLERGGKIVAVSSFIEDQMRLQWGFESTTVNNSVDLDEYSPHPLNKKERLLFVHGVTSTNKGFDHIDLVKQEFRDKADVLLLDEAKTKYNTNAAGVFSQADVVLHPSAYEGFSYFALEALACNAFIASYNVGFLYDVLANAKRNGIIPNIGKIEDVNKRSLQRTVEMVYDILSKSSIPNSREVAKLYSIDKFQNEWKKIISENLQS